MDALGELRTILTEAIVRDVPRSSVRTKIKELAEEVDVLMETVKEAFRMIGSKCKQGKNSQVHETALEDLERDTRNIVHDVGDIIHTYLVLTQDKSRSSALSGRMGIFTRSPSRPKLNGLWKKVRSMREEKLKSFLEGTRKTINEYSIMNNTSGGAQGTIDDVKKVQKDTVIGLDEVTETIVSYLLEEYFRLDVIRITGMPGVGKTTLASKVFNDPSIQSEFKTLIWIDVTKQKTGMLAAIWEKLFNQDTPSDDQHPAETLVQTIRMSLAKEKFLIVFDNVLSAETWKEIQNTLPMFNIKKGKVLVTSSAVYSQVSSRPIIRLKCMDERTGWELLHSHVYGEVLANNSGPELERFGKNIVNECGGLPRAIVKIAEILADKISLSGQDNADPLEIWEHVASNVKTYLFSSNCRGLMVDSVSKCYYMLHGGLKDCFLYLGMLPGDTEIPVWKLIQLWNAEGLIKPVHNLRSEQVASSYILELIERNLLTVKRWGLHYDPKTVVIHNMVREFCTSNAAVQKKHNFHEIKESQGGGFEPTSEEMERFRRLCIHSSSSISYFFQNPKLQNVSSFVCYTKDPINLEKKHVESFTDAFSMLRVLEANSINFPKFPDKLTRLLHLRYLALSGDKIKVLPRTTSIFLQIKTIIVNTLSPTLKVKANIWEMIHLRLFKTKAAIILNKEWKGKGGKNLQSLGNLSPKSCTDHVAYKAKNLKALGIRGELEKLLGSDFLEKLDSLDKLRLVNESKNKPLPKLPPSNQFPPHLKSLVLSGTFLSWEHMSTLGNLPQLMLLKLKNKAFMGDCWNTASGGFHKLVSLSIGHTNLRIWTASSNCFPKLGLLVLKYCKNLEGVPKQVAMNDKLSKLVMISVSRAVISSANEMENARRNRGGRDLRLLNEEENGNNKYGRIYSVEYSSSAQHQLGF